MDLCNLNELRPLLARHGFRFSRSMGQNFLIASWVPERIAAECGVDRSSGVVEIGPGVGALTRALASRAGKVAAVELDRALLPVLEETLSDCPNAEVIPGDVMKLDLGALVAEKLEGLTPVVCANLPYNITTPVLTRLLEVKLFACLTVMVQREVAQRICAAPGSKDYGAFSVFCQYHADCRRLFDVGPACFLPAPKVTSTVVQLIPLAAPAVAVRDEGAFFAVVHAAFAQRRKTLLNALSAAYASRYSKDELRGAIAACGLEENVRGERLGLEEFAALAEKLGGM